MHALGNDAAIATVRRHVRNHHVFKLDFKVFDARPVTIGPEELELGLRDRLACGTGLEQDGGSKIGQLVEADLVNVSLAAGMPTGCRYALGWVTPQCTLWTSIQPLCLSSCDSPLMSPICRYASIIFSLATG
jgi:hypothetical protein